MLKQVGSSPIELRCPCERPRGALTRLLKLTMSRWWSEDGPEATRRDQRRRSAGWGRLRRPRANGGEGKRRARRKSKIVGSFGHANDHRSFPGFRHCRPPLSRSGVKPVAHLRTLRPVCPTIAVAISSNRSHRAEDRPRLCSRQRTAVLICDERNAEPLFLNALGRAVRGNECTQALNVGNEIQRRHRSGDVAGAQVLRFCCKVRQCNTLTSRAEFFCRAGALPNVIGFAKIFSIASRCIMLRRKIPVPSAGCR